MDDYNLIVDSFKEQKLPFHTYTPNDKRPLTLMLKNIPPNLTPEDIIEDLQSKKMQVISAIQMNKKQIDNEKPIKLPMFKVNFQPCTTISEVVKHQFVSGQFTVDCSK